MAETGQYMMNDSSMPVMPTMADVLLGRGGKQYDGQHGNIYFRGRGVFGLARRAHGCCAFLTESNRLALF
jgi:hypothetical protein